MAKRMKKSAEVEVAAYVADVAASGLAVSERPEVYDERADAKDAEQKASFAAAAVKSQDLTPEQKDILNSREALKHPLAAGQGYFESPSGYVIVAQADRDRVWCQKENGGKGLWINPKR